MSQSSEGQVKVGFAIVGRDTRFWVAENYEEGLFLLGLDYQGKIWKTRGSAQRVLNKIFARDSMIAEPLRVLGVFVEPAADGGFGEVTYSPPKSGPKKKPSFCEGCFHYNPAGVIDNPDCYNCVDGDRHYTLRD